MKPRDFISLVWSRPKTPTVLQMEAVECGAACLAMVLAHYGRFVALEEVRVTCGVSRDGSKASNLVRAARHYGLDARGLRTEPHALEKLHLPAILHWNLNHFVVVDSVGDTWVDINDPAQGRRRVSREEVDLAFSGIALDFKPSPDFRRGGNAQRAMVPLLRRLRGSSRHVIFVVLVALLLVVPGLATPAFSKIFVDELLIGGAREWLRPLLIAMTLSALALAALTMLQREFLVRFETRLSSVGSAQFFWHVLRLPVGFFAQRYGGEVGARVGMNDRIAGILTGDLAVSFVGAMTVIFYAATMVRYDAYIATIGIVAAAINIASLLWIGQKRRDASQLLVQERGKLIGVAMGGLQTIETLKASGSESDFFARWSGHHAKLLNAQQLLGEKTQLLMIVPPAVASFASVLVLALGADRVIDGRLTMGALVAFQGLLLGFLAPVGRFVSLGASFQEAQGDLRRLEDVLLAKPDAEAPVNRLSDVAPGVDRSVFRPRLRGEVRIRNLSFGFSPLDPPLIQKLSVELRPGTCVAVVGGSGSGKSTLARLVCGLYTPWSGEILFDGKRRMEIDPRVLAGSIAYVDQEVFLFEGSVRDNIALWDESLPESVIVRAAKDACIHDLIAARAGAYRAAVSEGGRNFSGGQRQRIEIARALALRPSILVMDEASSALDAETEREVSLNVRRRGCTCLIVAHRLSTVRDADEILVMDRGAVVERGTHDALMHAGGMYRRLMEKE